MTTPLDRIHPHGVQPADSFCEYNAVALMKDGTALAVHMVGVEELKDSYPPLGNEFPIFIHTHYRESEPVLYGFETPRARGVFRRLLTAKGVGPMAASRIMMRLSDIEIDNALRSKDFTKVGKIKGIGPSAIKSLKAVKPFCFDGVGEQMELT